jgi:Domain of unknown function (DUF4412)
MLLLAHLVVAPLLLAGGTNVYFEQLTVTSTEGHSEGAGVVSRVWYGGRRMRLEAGDAEAGPAFVLQLDRGKAYRIDPAEKAAIEIDLERLRSSTQMDLSVAGDLMGGDEEGAGRTAALKTPKTIAGYRCSGYRIKAGSAIMDVYVTEEIPLGVESFAELLDWTGASQALRGILDEVRKLPGFPLETRSRVSVMGKVHETRSTVTRVKVGPQAPSLFEVPRDYQVRAEEPPPEQD